MIDIPLQRLHLSIMIPQPSKSLPFLTGFLPWNTRISTNFYSTLLIELYLRVVHEIGPALSRPELDEGAILWQSSTSTISQKGLLRSPTMSSIRMKSHTVKDYLGKTLRRMRLVSRVRRSHRSWTSGSCRSRHSLRKSCSVILENLRGVFCGRSGGWFRRGMNQIKIKNQKILKKQFNLPCFQEAWQELELPLKQKVEVLIQGIEFSFRKRIGSLSFEQRRLKLLKYLQKKRLRKWRKKVSYDCRKKVADSRLRIKGKFVTRQQVCEQLGIQDYSNYTGQEIKELLQRKLDEAKDKSTE